MALISGWATPEELESIRRVGYNVQVESRSNNYGDVWVSVFVNCNVVDLLVLEEEEEAPSVDQIVADLDVPAPDPNHVKCPCCDNGLLLLELSGGRDIPCDLCNGTGYIPREKYEDIMKDVAEEPK